MNNKKIKTLVDIQSLRMHKFDKITAINYAQILLDFLMENYSYGDYNPQVLKMIGSYNDQKHFVFTGETTDVSIYDALAVTGGEPIEGCGASHFIVEMEGIILLEIYSWYDKDYKTNVFDIKKRGSDLTRQFKLLAYQIINGNYLEK